jgi:hypothetical protein
MIDFNMTFKSANNYFTFGKCYYMTFQEHRNLSVQIIFLFTIFVMSYIL